MGKTVSLPHGPPERFVPNPKLKFLEQCREVMRFKHLARRTEETYLQWIRRFILFHRRPGPSGKWIWRHPKDMGEAEVRAFLTDLAVERQVSAATQNQALNALLFLYREVLGVTIEGVEAVRADRPVRVPVVLSRAECWQLLEALEGTSRLMAELMYGSGVRLMELLRLRVHPVR
jgi:integrase